MNLNSIFTTFSIEIKQKIKKFSNNLSFTLLFERRVFFRRSYQPFPGIVMANIWILQFYIVFNDNIHYFYVNFVIEWSQFSIISKMIFNKKMASPYSSLELPHFWVWILLFSGQWISGLKNF